MYGKAPGWYVFRSGQSVGRVIALIYTQSTEMYEKLMTLMGRQSKRVATGMTPSHTCTNPDSMSKHFSPNRYPKKSWTLCPNPHSFRPISSTQFVVIIRFDRIFFPSIEFNSSKSALDRKDRVKREDEALAGRAFARTPLLFPLSSILHENPPEFSITNEYFAAELNDQSHSLKRKNTP